MILSHPETAGGLPGEGLSCNFVSDGVIPLVSTTSNEHAWTWPVEDLFRLAARSAIRCAQIQAPDYGGWLRSSVHLAGLSNLVEICLGAFRTYDTGRAASRHAFLRHADVAISVLFEKKNKNSKTNFKQNIQIMQFLILYLAILVDSVLSDFCGLCTLRFLRILH